MNLLLRSNGIEARGILAQQSKWADFQIAEELEEFAQPIAKLKYKH